MRALAMVLIALVERRATCARVKMAISHVLHVIIGRDARGVAWRTRARGVAWLARDGFLAWRRVARARTLGWGVYTTDDSVDECLGLDDDDDD